MTSNALTNEEKHVTPNRACARSQQYPNIPVFWLAINDVMLYDITYCPAFCQPDFISDGPTNGSRKVICLLYSFVYDTSRDALVFTILHKMLRHIVS